MATSLVSAFFSSVSQTFLCKDPFNCVRIHLDKLTNLSISRSLTELHWHSCFFFFQPYKVAITGSRGWVMDIFFQSRALFSPPHLPPTQFSTPTECAFQPHHIISSLFTSSSFGLSLVPQIHCLAPCTPLPQLDILVVISTFAFLETLMHFIMSVFLLKK